MSAEGVRRTCDAVCTGSAISQAKGQGFKSAETKHHVYGILWKVDSFIDFFIFYLLLIFYFFTQDGVVAGLRGVIRRGDNMK